jgi:hypothetical protein
MSTTSSAKRLGIAAGLTTAGLAAAGSITRGEAPRLRHTFGAFGVAIGLTALAGVAPGVAAALAVVIIITALLTSGATTIARIAAATLG